METTEATRAERLEWYGDLEEEALRLFRAREAPCGLAAERGALTDERRSTKVSGESP